MLVFYPSFTFDRLQLVNFSLAKLNDSIESSFLLILKAAVH